MEGRGGRLWLGPGSPWSQESASTDPEGLPGGSRRSEAQGVPRGHPASQGQGQGQRPGLSALAALLAPCSPSQKDWQRHSRNFFQNCYFQETLGTALILYGPDSGLD